MEVQAVTVPLVLLRAAVRVLGVPAPALAVRALEVLVLDTLALEVLHVAVQRAPVQDLLAVVRVLGALVHVLAAPALETPALGALTPVVTLGTPARVDIQGPTLAALAHRATPAAQIHRGTQGLTLVAPAHAAILILTQAIQDLRVTLILIQVIPTRRVIQTRAQAVLITTTAITTITTAITPTMIPTMTPTKIRLTTIRPAIIVTVASLTIIPAIARNSKTWILGLYLLP